MRGNDTKLRLQLLLRILTQELTVLLHYRYLLGLMTNVASFSLAFPPPGNCGRHEVIAVMLPENWQSVFRLETDPEWLGAFQCKTAGPGPNRRVHLPVKTRGSLQFVTADGIVIEHSLNGIVIEHSLPGRRVQASFFLKVYFSTSGHFINTD